MELIILSIAKYFSVIIFCFAFISLRWSVAFYIAYLCLFPISSLSFLPYSLLSLTILFVCFYKYGIREKKKISFIALVPYVYLLFALGILMPFQYTPFSFQFNEWRIELFNGVILPFVMWNVLLNEKKDVVKLFINLFIFLVIITGIYGLILTQAKGFNPYVLLFSAIDGKELAENWLGAEGRLFGRISSTFDHPMRWAFFLGLSFILFYGIRKIINKWLGYFLLFLILMNMIVCGVRTVVVAVAIIIIFYLLMKRQLKLILMVGVFFLGLLIVVNSNEILSDYLYSIIDFSSKKTNIAGSSVEMRLDQLNGAFKEIKDSLLIGNGYGWNHYYMRIYGDHPVLLAFESLIFTILCNSGILGLIIWTIFFIISLYIPKLLLNFRENILIIWCLTLYYFIYCVATGDYAYMRLYYIFYVLLIGIYCIQEKRKRVLLEYKRYIQLKKLQNKSKENVV